MAAICSLVSTSWACCASASVDGGDGLLDAALERDRVGAGGDVAQPLADERLGQDGRGRRAVAGHVVGLLGDFLDQFGAELLVRVVEFDLLGDAHAVVGDGGRAPLRVRARRCGPSGPSVTFTVSARMFMPRSRPRRASSPNTINLAICVVLYLVGADRQHCSDRPAMTARAIPTVGVPSHPVGTRKRRVLTTV